MHSQSPQIADKLQEAQYFLDQMSATEGHETFRYNVSAFLGAARSIKDAVKQEIAAHLRAADRRADRAAAMAHVEHIMAADGEMRLLTEKRDTTHHEGGLLLVEAKMEEVPPIQFSTKPGIDEWLRRRWRRTAQRHVVPRSRIFMPGQPQARVYEPRWFFAEIPDRDAYTVCAEHLLKITEAVKNATKRYMQ